MELQDLLGDFEERGIGIAAVSANEKDLAERAVAEWGLNELTVGYGLPLDEARRWGLFVSSAIKETEPAFFVEPGQFVIRPDRTLYSSIVQTMPFSRPPAKQLLSSLEFIIEKDYPARGEVAPESA